MFTHAPNSNELTRTHFILQNWISILFSALFILLLTLAPTDARAQIQTNCTYGVDGTLKVNHKDDYKSSPKDSYKDVLGTNQSTLEGVEVRLQGSRGDTGVWGLLAKGRTNANGNFDLSETKFDCSKRGIRVQARFTSPDLEIRTGATTKWYTVYKTVAHANPSNSQFKKRNLNLTFRNSGNKALNKRVPWYQAEIWTLYQKTMDRMAIYGGRFKFEKKVKVSYPHNHINPKEGVSYANPATKLVLLVINSNKNHDGGKNPLVALHELMHIWAYQHTRGEGNVAVRFFLNGFSTHGIVKTPYVAFHEGFAEWAAQFVKEQIGPKTARNPWSPSHLRNYKSGVSSFGILDRADHGWYNIFSLMQAPRPWEFNFTGQGILSRTNTTASDIIPFKNCSVGQLDFRELLNIIDRKGQKDISTGDMNWSSHKGRVVSQSNGVNSGDIQAYKKMLDPSSSREDILGSMCDKGEGHTVVVKGENIPGKTDYTVKASRAIKQIDGTLEGHKVSIQSRDDDSGATATGRVSSGADGFKVAGDIKEITLDTPDAATVYVDGKEYHTVVITSENVSGKTTYTMKASDNLTQVGGSLDGHGVTIDQPDQVNGATASGRVSSGTDGFKVIGTIQEIRLDNPDAATVYVDDGGPLGGGAPLQVYATRPVSGDGTADFGKTGADVRFQGTSGSATVSVRKLGNGPSGMRGMPKSNVSDYRFVFDTVGNLSFGTGTEVRLEVGTLAGSGNGANVTVYKRPTEGSGQFSPLTTTFDSGQNELVATTGSFSEFVLASDSEPLPVEMASFDATLHDSKVRLHWQTASETNNAGFEVQRQKEKEGWTQIGYVESKAEGGTTTEGKSYSYEAEDLPAGTHQFRLRQVDLDGSSTLTDPVSVEVQMQGAVKLTAPAPNPVSTSAKLSFAVKEQAEATIRLYNALGQRVATLYQGVPQAGEQQTARIDASGLPSGTYFLRLQADGQTRTQRFTVVR